MTQTAEDLLKGLNPGQLEATKDTVKKGQASLVLAAAGSGKTGVLTRRTAYLMTKKNVPAKNIMAVTFTNKAASEMRERVEGMVGKDAMKGLTIGTFHQICVRILRVHASKVGLNSDFTIADESDKKDIMKKICLKIVGDDKAQTLRFYLGAISDLKNKMMLPKDVPSKDKDLAEIYRQYQNELIKHNMVDFDDMLLKVATLLEFDPQVRESYQKKFKYIMIDEYQDTNPCQYKIISSMVGDLDVTDNNFFAVGDPDQAIYSWRGGDVGIILAFQEDYPNANVIYLEQNYRSTQTIVEAGNAVIKHNTNRFDKNAFSAGAKGDKIKLNEAITDIEEARFIVEEIKNLVKFGGRKYGEIALLYRANFQSQILEKELVKQMVPYRIVGHVAFYDRMEIKDTLAYLRVITNPKDDIAMKRVINLHPGIGKTTVEAIEDIAIDKNVSMMEAMKLYKPRREATKLSIEDLRELLNKMWAVARVAVASEGTTQGVVLDMLDTIWRRTNYITKLTEDGSKEALDRIENLRELVKVAKVYQETSPQPTIAEFLQETSLQSEQAKQKDGSVVSLMTMHAAKGLEFPVVFISGFEEGVFPHRNSFTDEKLMEEERNLCYVAITRAKEDLYITLAKQRRTYKGLERNPASRFLFEIPKELILEL